MMRGEKISKNNYWKIVISAITLIVANLQNVYATEPPYLKNVKIKASINLDAQSGLYNYQYTVKNSQESTGNLIGLDIDISYPSDGAVLKKERLSIPYGKESRNFDQSIPPTAKVTMIPVGMIEPNGWMALLSVYGTAGWGGGDYVQLKQGQSLSGLRITSYGLPGIREFKAEPAIDFDADYYPGWESVKGAADESAAIIAKIDQFYEKISFRGKTVGPTAPPAIFSPTSFLDYIIDLKHQAFSLGWIDNSGIVNSLDVKLDNARKKLAEGSPGAAKNILNAFINEVEAQGCVSYENCPPGKHLTSEAYALLKYNAQYLIDNLK